MNAKLKLNKYLSQCKYIFIHSLLQFILTHYYHYKIINVTLYLHYILIAKFTTQRDRFLDFFHHSHMFHKVSLIFGLRYTLINRGYQANLPFPHLPVRPSKCMCTLQPLIGLISYMCPEWLWLTLVVRYIIKLITINTEINVKYIQFYFLHCTFYLV